MSEGFANNLSGTNTGDNATNTQYVNDYRAANFAPGVDYLAPYASQTQKYVLAAPNAIDGTPSFRALLASDIPALGYETSGAVATHEALQTDVHGLAITAGKTLTVQNGVTITGALGSAA